MHTCYICEKTHTDLDSVGYCCYKEKCKNTEKRSKLRKQINQCLEKHGLELTSDEYYAFIETVIHKDLDIDNRRMTELILEWIRKNCKI